MRRTFLVLALALACALAACKREAPPPEPKTIAPQAEGSTTIVGKRRDLRDARIEVTTPLLPQAMASCQPSKTEFAAGEPIQLHLKLNQAPSELVVGARVIDDKDEIAYVTAPAEGKKEVTVTVKEDLDPGTYKLEGYWGGNLVCEHEIRID